MNHIRGRFRKAANKLAAQYTASIPFDWRLYPYDIAGSIAHAKMLATAPERVGQALAAAREIIGEPIGKK